MLDLHRFITGWQQARDADDLQGRFGFLVMCHNVTTAVPDFCQQALDLHLSANDQQGDKWGSRRCWSQTAPEFSDADFLLYLDAMALALCCT